MLDLAIIIILLFGCIVGLKRGFILQVIHLTGFIIAFVVAYIYYDKLAPKLTLWIPFPNITSDHTVKLLLDFTNIEDAFYRTIAFMIIFTTVKIVLQIIGSMLDFVANFPVIKQLNTWAGGILGFVEVYLIMFLILYIAALVPISSIQDPLNGSFIASMIIKHTPILSAQLKGL